MGGPTGKAGAVLTPDSDATIEQAVAISGKDGLFSDVYRGTHGRSGLVWYSRP